jgi:thiol-disulfide isomerase/thioredoxin
LLKINQGTKLIIMKFSVIILAIIFNLSTITAQTIPDFKFIGLNGETITRTNLQTNQPVFVFFFDPWCDHCQQQADWIYQEMEKFTYSNLLWVTTESESNVIKEFEEKHFKNSKHVIFCIDSEFMFDSWFDGYYEVPSVIVFNKSWKKITVLNKETPVEILLNTLSQ